MALAALGVVFGDIGTSPIYTVQGIFSAGRHTVGVSVALGHGCAFERRRARCDGNNRSH